MKRHKPSCCPLARPWMHGMLALVVGLSSAPSTAADVAVPALPAPQSLNPLGRALDVKIEWQGEGQPPVLPALRGRYESVAEALRAWLQNTPWEARPAGNGRWVVGFRAPQSLERVEVTGSHLRQRSGEIQAAPVIVVTRQDIERSGLTTLADLKQIIPQLSVGSAVTFDGNSSRSAPDGRLLFDLRGLNAGNTLVLVDGRRVAKTGQRTVAEAYEATGIPLSAVERVEVLVGGGSAIYGADAVGGVVNIITRRRYQGLEVEWARDNSFKTDSANDRLTLIHGARVGSWSTRLFVSHEKQNPLGAADR